MAPMERGSINFVGRRGQRVGCCKRGMGRIVPCINQWGNWCLGWWKRLKVLGGEYWMDHSITSEGAFIFV